MSCQPGPRRPLTSGRDEARTEIPEPKGWTWDAYFLFTNRRGSDVDGPIPHAKPDRHTHIRAVPDRRGIPQLPDIPQPPLAVALQLLASKPRPPRKPHGPYPPRPR